MDERPTIACALERDAPLTERCTIERLSDERGVLLVIGHPNAGYRRFRIEGGRPVAADGALEAHVTIAEDGAADVHIDGRRYRIPLERTP